jgi:hypothetical protein
MALIYLQMNLRALNTAHRRAAKAAREQHAQCEIMAAELQEFFDEDISVLYQESDGFVILHSTNDEKNLNTHIDDVVAAIKKDPNAFR